MTCLNLHLIHVAAKSKRLPETGCSFHDCVPKEDHGNTSVDHCFLERVGNESRGKKPQTLKKGV